MPRSRTRGTRREEGAGDLGRCLPRPPAGSAAAGPAPGPRLPPEAPAEAVSGCRAPSCARRAAGPRGAGGRPGGPGAVRVGPGSPCPAAPVPPAGGPAEVLPSGAQLATPGSRGCFPKPKMLGSPVVRATP